MEQGKNKIKTKITIRKNSAVICFYLTVTQNASCLLTDISVLFHSKKAEDHGILQEIQIGSQL